VKLVDTSDSKSDALKSVPVRVRPPVPLPLYISGLGGLYLVPELLSHRFVKNQQKTWQKYVFLAKSSFVGYSYRALTGHSKQALPTATGVFRSKKKL
jgi:hypothetical protein